MGISEAEIINQLEELRRQLHLLVGPEYNEKKLDEARELSKQIDHLVIQVTKFLKD